MHQQVLPDMAAFSVEELDARLNKVQAVLKEMGVGIDALNKARDQLKAAKRALADKQWASACRGAEAGLRTVRVLQHRTWQDVYAAVPSGTRQRRVDFYLLPDVARQVRLLQTGTWGPNRLANGSFETEKGWGGAKWGHRMGGQSSVVAGAGRTGKRALCLRSKSPTIYHGDLRDWVTVHVVSDKIPAREHEIWRITAWVRVPKKLDQTERGVTVALLAYDAKGKNVMGYGHESEVTQAEATDGWKQVRAIVPLRSPLITTLAARLSLCGVGEAYLDDVVVQRLEPGKRPKAGD